VTNPPSPTISDQYWFDYSKSLLDGAEARRDQAAAKLQNLVLWLWGIYTSVTSIGFALSDKSLEIGPTLLIASGSAALVAVYWATVWVQMPVTIAFDPRSPTSIRRAHGDSMRRKKARLNVTLFLSLVAAFWVSGAMIVASLSKSRGTEYKFAATVEASTSGSSVMLTGFVPDTDRVKVDVKRTEKGKEEVISSQSYLLEKGLLQTSIPVAVSPAVPLLLTVSWENSAKDSMSFSRQLKAK